MVGGDQCNGGFRHSRYLEGSTMRSNSPIFASCIDCNMRSTVGDSTLWAPYFNRHTVTKGHNEKPPVSAETTSWT
uniref:Uncharacterized protein n=1 Tax=Physcomitrium patens TaxID=3218 RepID=A0A2K1K6H8_PHYPA|nr:hypothetical protein PHYPA_011280 [Physcomitrium patens]